MYKIYVNGTPVFLATGSEATELGYRPDRDLLVNFYGGKKRQLHNFIDLLEKNTTLRAVVLWSDDVEKMWSDFQSCFRIIEAAGGLVKNQEGKLLVFFRRDFWDLPKGKIDEGESPEQAAVREVQEETGLKNVELGEFVAHTWHTYRQKKERILKKTWWFRMATSDTELVPQVEEDIEQIEWVDAAAWLAGVPKIYPSLLEIL